MKDKSTEINQWIRQLENLRHKNAAYKIALSEMVDKSVFSDFLSKAELLHNELIANDESIFLLTDSANHLLSNSGRGNNISDDAFSTKKKQLAHDIRILSQRFDQLQLLITAEMQGN